MSNEKKQKISRATMTRFPVYLKALRVMGHEGKENFLSSEDADAAMMSDITFKGVIGFQTQVFANPEFDRIKGRRYSSGLMIRLSSRACLPMCGKVI